MKLLPFLGSATLGLMASSLFTVGCRSAHEGDHIGTALHPLSELKAEGKVIQRFRFEGHWYEQAARVKRVGRLAGGYIEEVILDDRGAESARRYFGWQPRARTLTGVWMDDRGGRPVVAEGEQRATELRLFGTEDFGQGPVEVRWTLSESGAVRRLEMWSDATEAFELILEERHGE